MLGTELLADPPNIIDLGFFILIGPTLGFLGSQLLEESDRARRQHAHLQSILETVPEAMIVIDQDGIMHSFSSAAEKLFGWSVSEAVGRNVSMLMPSPQRQEHSSYLHRYLECGERRIIGIGRIVVGERKDGSTFPMEIAVGEAVIGDRHFFTGFVKDLTERRNQEQRMQELQSELIHVSRLTAMGEMASSLAHELNQPLSAVTSYLRGAQTLVLQQRTNDARIHTALDRAAEQALRAGEIISRLREFVAKGDNSATLQAPAMLLEQATALALFGARDLGINVTLQCEPDLPPIFADGIQIQQVVLNLIRNAIDAMENVTKRELGIYVRRDGRFARFTISDSGSGLDPSVSDRLFQPFVSTKRSGMGVGLSICRTIVEAHNGRIWAEPQAGGGTSFNFTIPFIEKERE